VRRERLLEVFAQVKPPTRRLSTPSSRREMVDDVDSLFPYLRIILSAYDECCRRPRHFPLDQPICGFLSVSGKLALRFLFRYPTFSSPIPQFSVGPHSAVL